MTLTASVNWNRRILTLNSTSLVACYASEVRATYDMFPNVAMHNASLYRIEFYWQNQSVWSILGLEAHFHARKFPRTENFLSAENFPGGNAP